MTVEPILGLAALFSAILTPATPSDDMQRYIDRGLIDGTETGPWSVMLWDALRRHDIAPLWERPHYCGRHAYDALSALIKRESNFDPTTIYINSDGSLDLGLVQINSEQPPEHVSPAFAHDPFQAIDYLVKYVKRGMIMRWHAWGKIIMPRWCGVA